MSKLSEWFDSEKQTRKKIKHSPLVCAICKRNFVGSVRLSFHISSKHNITKKEYYDKYLKKENEGFCQNIFCQKENKETAFINITKGYNKLCGSKQCLVDFTNWRRKEAWLNKGYSEEEAKLKIKEIQSKCFENFKKDKTTIELFEFQKQKSIRCKEYWMKQGLSEYLAEKKVTEIQLNFSLEKCIKKHGEEKGTEIWQQRQDKWQATLNSKSKEEKVELNKSKNPWRFSDEKTKKKYIRKCFNCGIQLFLKVEELIDFIQKLKEDLWIQKLTIEQFINYRFVRKDCYRFLELNEKFFLQTNFGFPIEQTYFEGNCPNNFSWSMVKTKTVEEGFLRSSKEINFYRLLKENNIENFIVGKRYPNSRKFCDFYLKDFDLYVEIAGMMEDAEYAENIKKKSIKFNSVVLINNLVQKDFIFELLQGNSKKYQHRKDL